MKAAVCRNRHCFLLGVGWPSVAMGTEKRIYIYLGPLLFTLRWGA